MFDDARQLLALLVSEHEAVSGLRLMIVLLGKDEVKRPESLLCGITTIFTVILAVLGIDVVVMIMIINAINIVVIIVTTIIINVVIAKSSISLTTLNVIIVTDAV